MVQHMRRDLDFVSLSNLYMGYNETGEPNSSLGELLPIYVKKWFNFTAHNVAGKSIDNYFFFIILSKKIHDLTFLY